VQVVFYYEYLVESVCCFNVYPSLFLELPQARPGILKVDFGNCWSRTVGFIHVCKPTAVLALV